MLGSRLTEFFKIFGLAALVLFISFALFSCKSDTEASKGAAQENITLAALADVMGKAGAQHSGIFDLTQSEGELFIVYHFYTIEQKDIDDDVGVEIGPKIRDLYKKFKTLDHVYFDVDVWRSGVDSDWTSYCHFLMTRAVFDKTNWTGVLDTEFFKTVLDLKYND